MEQKRPLMKNEFSLKLKDGTILQPTMSKNEKI